MQYFQDTATQKVWAFDDDVKVTSAGGVYSFETAGGEALTKVPTTLQPISALPTPVPFPVDYPALAQVELDKSDIAIIRCVEHGVTVPAEWTAYRAALRAIVAGTSTVTALPAAPPYPAGT